MRFQNASRICSSENCGNKAGTTTTDGFAAHMVLVSPFVAKACNFGTSKRCQDMLSDSFTLDLTGRSATSSSGTSTRRFPFDMTMEQRE